MTIKELEEYGYGIFQSTMSYRHPEWTITSTSADTFCHHDADVVTEKGEKFEIEIKTRLDYRIDTFDDLQIDDTKVDAIQKDLKEGKYDRAFLAGIYPNDGELVIWEIKKDVFYECEKSYRPKKTVAEKKELVLKCMVSFPMSKGKRIKIKTEKDEQ